MSSNSSSMAAAPKPTLVDTGQIEGEGVDEGWQVVEKRRRFPVQSGSSQSRGLLNRGGGLRGNQNPRAGGWRRPPSGSSPLVAAKTPISYREILSGGNEKSKRGSLTFVQPRHHNSKLVAVIEEPQIYNNAKKWANSIIVYVDNYKPYAGHLSAYIQREWKPKGEFTCYARDDGFFMVKFSGEDDVNGVLEGGPWLFDGRLIIMKRWTEKIKFDKEVLNVIPIWVKFPRLNLNWLDEKSISTIASVLGNPICLDRDTLNQSKINFARVMIEMSADRAFPDSVDILLPSGEIIEQPVVYDYKPLRCEICSCFGHIAKFCSKNGEKVWKEKQKINHGNIAASSSGTSNLDVELDTSKDKGKEIETSLLNHSSSGINILEVDLNNSKGKGKEIETSLQNQSLANKNIVEQGENNGEVDLQDVSEAINGEEPSVYNAVERLEIIGPAVEVVAVPSLEMHKELNISTGGRQVMNNETGVCSGDIECEKDMGREFSKGLRQEGEAVGIETQKEVPESDDDTTNRGLYTEIHPEWSNKITTITTRSKERREAMKKATSEEKVSNACSVGILPGNE